MPLPLQISTDISIDLIDEHHAEDYFQLLHHCMIKPYVPSQCIPKDIEGAQKELRSLFLTHSNGSGFYWGIYTKNKLIGTCGLHSFNSLNKTIEVSYEVHPDFWSQGIATTCVHFTVEQTPMLFPVEKIRCFTLSDNIASQKVAIKTGFKRVSLLEKDCYFNGKLVDRILFEIIL